MNTGSVPLVESRKLSDAEIVERVRGGETGLFEILVRRHNQQVYRAARSIVRKDADAEDAVQQGWLLAFSRLSQFAGQAKFSTWLTRIIIHEALARRGAARVEGLNMADVEQQPTSSPSACPERKAELGELTRLLERSLAQLSEGNRVVFVLREVQCLSTADAAACLDVSEEVIKVRLHRAKEQLRDLLAAHLDDATPQAWAFLGQRCDRMVEEVMAAVVR